MGKINDKRDVSKSVKNNICPVCGEDIKLCKCSYEDMCDK